MMYQREDYLIILGLVGFSYITLASVAAFFLYGLPLVVLSVTLFIYVLISGTIVLKTLFLLWVIHTARRLKFKLITGYFEQPRLIGEYRNHDWQIHFRDKEKAKHPVVMRTYIKLIFHSRKKFDEKEMKKLAMRIRKFSIITIGHIIREDKNYILMKVSGYIFSKRGLQMLMDHLLDIYEASEIK